MLLHKREAIGGKRVRPYLRWWTSQKGKCGFEPDTYEQVKKFYMRDDVSTALPGKEVDFKRKYLMITLMTFPKYHCGKTTCKDILFFLC